jgi:NAD(P)-dependent dehydrogenase (short-subunit alcohol dehydrogenase family)
MILVVGATGLLGSRICERLRSEGQPVRALVRRTSNPDKVNALRSLGCELATGDLKDPPQIQAACQGISALISTASSTLSRQPGDSIESVDLQGQLALANAARSAGVRRFIYVSFRDDRTVQYPLTQAKRSVERASRISTSRQFKRVGLWKCGSRLRSASTTFMAGHAFTAVDRNRSVGYPTEMWQSSASPRSFVPSQVALCSRWVVPKL